VVLYIAFYRSQDQDHKLITSTNTLVTSDDPGWHRVASGQREITIDQRATVIRTAALRGPQQSKWVAWEWYWINGEVTSSDAWGKLTAVLARLRGLQDDSAVIVLYAPQEQINGADAALAAFAETAVPRIETVLRQAGKQP
jgi:EpsI family protein